MPNFPNRTLAIMDNLRFLLSLENACIDLIAIDPPFGKMETFRSDPKPPITEDELREEIALFMAHTGRGEDEFPEYGLYTQVGDLWEWNRDISEKGSHAAFYREIANAQDGSLPKRIHSVIEAVIATAGHGMAAYICFMAQRLVECHRVLKDTGSIYVHCDWKANSHLRMLLDTIFGSDNFRNEIAWRRVLGGKSDAGQYPRSSDRILFYTKGQDFTFHSPRLKDVNDSWYRKRDNKGRYSSQKLTAHGSTSGDSGQPWRGKMPTGHWVVPRVLTERYETETGETLAGSVRERLDVLADAGYIEFSKSGLPSWRRYLSEVNPPRVSDIWADDEVKPISRRSPERTGYSTQKPLKLYERIIAASSNEGDVVLDVFAGCATTAVAAENLGRQWIACDWSYRSLTMIKRRFYQNEGLRCLLDGDTASTTSATAAAFGNPRLNWDEDLDVKPWRVIGPNDVAPREQALPGPEVSERQRYDPRWNGNIPKDECKTMLLDRFGFVCWGCNWEPKLPNGAPDPHMLEVEHLFAKKPADGEEGGDDNLYNLGIACRKCNGVKGNRLTMTQLRDDRALQGLVWPGEDKRPHLERARMWAIGEWGQRHRRG